MTAPNQQTVLRRVADWLASRPAIALTQVVAVIALMLSGVIVYQYLQLTECLASYNNDDAASRAARTEAADEDRRADLADREADEEDRRAFRAVIAAIAAQDQAAARTAFAGLVATHARTDEARARTAAARAESERKRRENPPPPPPELRCGRG